MVQIGVRQTTRRQIAARSRNRRHLQKQQWKRWPLLLFSQYRRNGIHRKNHQQQHWKSVYAKVLDVIPDIKQNTGLVICISNAAAIELGFPSGKFDCNLVYSK